MTNVITIPEAAAKHGLGEKGDKRLRWAVVLGTRRADDEEYKGYPIGDPAADLVQDDETLARWVEKQTWA
jgi:hypothetical protein